MIVMDAMFFSRWIFALAALLCFSDVYAEPVLESNAVGLVVDESDYRLGSSDKIEIVVFGEEDLSVERRVNSRGMVSYPLLGSIKVKGKTVDQVAAMLESYLRGDYLVAPQINVSVLEYRPVFVRGEVRDPGGFPYSPGLTIGKAIALAGGFTQRASRKKIDVSREVNNGDRSDVKLGINEIVYPGDVLIVNESFF